MRPSSVSWRGTIRVRGRGAEVRMLEGLFGRQTFGRVVGEEGGEERETLVAGGDRGRVGGVAERLTVPGFEAGVDGVSLSCWRVRCRR